VGVEVPPFARRFFEPGRGLARIGAGGLGGKALGLFAAHQALARHPDALSGLPFALDIPALVVLGTEVFEAFLERNRLAPLVAEEPADDRIAHAFTRADLPAEIVGDLRAIANEVRQPLAVRSSSALEDARGQPFAGVYGTKMVPGSQKDPDARFRALVDAVKFVYASAFFHEARAYRRATGHSAFDERMAVVVQEVVGRAHGDRYYPDVSGVARSYNFYPTGTARPEDGVVHLALGLGKTIVDGGLCWSFSPAQPRAVPPFNSPRDLVQQTQSRFWAVHTGPPPAYDPMAETEYLVEKGLAAAEDDETLRLTASTYDPRSERLVAGIGRPGTRVLDFAPLLVHDEVPLVSAIRRLLELGETAANGPAEIEFALVLPRDGPGRVCLLQVRPILVPGESVEVLEEELSGAGVLVASLSSLGNGRHEVRDLLFVDPRTFEARLTPDVAREIEVLNRDLLDAGRPYLLIGFGRWGSSDPWLGIPVRWDQIAGARGIVEAGRPGMRPEPSQGSHFFHNLSSFEVLYFTVPDGEAAGIDWEWLQGQEPATRTDHVRHVRTERPIVLKVDGRSRRGLARREGAFPEEPRP
jgi:pyruvate phosphate dikinase-like enzyme